MAGVCICGFIGAVIQPWVLVDHIGIFLTITGSLWSTIYGMTIVDFFLIRKRRLNVPDLYRRMEDSIFYANGINPAGIISFIVGLGACMLFSSVAFIAGSVVSGICYYVLMKLWVLKNILKRNCRRIRKVSQEFLQTGSGFTMRKRILGKKPYLIKTVAYRGGFIPSRQLRIFERISNMCYTVSKTIQKGTAMEYSRRKWNIAWLAVTLLLMLIFSYF